MAKRILSTLLCVVLTASSFVFANAATTSESSTSANNAYTLASQALDDKYGYNGDDLGATYSPESTTFKVWSPTATEVSVNLYATGSDSEEGAEDLGTTALEKVCTNPEDPETFTGVWSVTIEGDLKNKYYTYTITAANVTGSKTTTRETQDIYSVATGVNGNRSMICDLESTNPDNWNNEKKHVFLDKSTDSSVWEVHVKDFSYNENSGVSEKNRGKYLAFTETGTTLNNEGKVSTCIDYLKELGITTVQINPFYDFSERSVDETGSDTQFNWGYDPVNYNVPDGSYSSNPYDGNVRIKECKQMIQALHDAGISVVMDVVYNHTYSYDSCFEYTVPNYYYRMTAAGSYSNGTGCGNETASERLMFRNFVVQSCLYWVNEYHVDGFRFDLMGCMDVETMNIIRAELDKIDERITMWGEGWTGGTCTYAETTCTGEKLIPGIQASSDSLNERVAYFNDDIRNGLKGSVFTKEEGGWIQGVNSAYQLVYFGLKANTDGGNWKAKSPQQCVTYASCHDNQTLWDKLCASHALTSYYRTRNSRLVAENKMTGGILAMSQGITFMLAGEEMGRSKDGDENSYSSSAAENMIDWSLIKSNADIVSYYKGMLDIRNNFTPLTDNTDNSSGKFRIYTGRALSSTLVYTWSNDTPGQWKNLAVLANNTKDDVDYTINPMISGINDWVIIANDESAGVTSLGEAKNGVFKIPARSMIVAVDKESFQSANIATDKGKVNVKSVNKSTGEILDSYTMTGTIGTKYSASAPNSVGLEYEAAGVEGEADGTYKAEDQNVTLYFDNYVPDSVTKEVNGDSKLNINDATYLQRAIAKVITLTEEQTAVADYTCDGKVDINDVTMLQKHLAGMNVATGTVTVNYYAAGTTDKIANSEVYTGRVGTSYTSKKASALGYELDEKQLPDDTVTVAYGNTDINYYYNYVSADVKIHVKHNADGTYAPTLWVWGSKNGVDSESKYCVNKTWPGDTLTLGEDGWYTMEFTSLSSDNSYNVIVSNAGSPQSADCKGFTQNELWVYIDDHADGVSLLFYDVNPEENLTAKPIYQG